MKKWNWNAPLSLAALLLLFPPALAQTPIGPGFTYQGRLTQSGVPFNGTADLTFRLYDAPSGGSLLGTQTLNGVSVAGGFFTVTLNGLNEFGDGTFNGQRRWLEISVNGTPLSPRQEVSPAPYALFAAAPWKTSGASLWYNGGNVGIGTAVPGFPLTIQPSGSNFGWIHTDGTIQLGSYVDRFFAGGWLGTRTNHPLYLFTNGSTPRVTLDTAGNLGIGTLAPAGRLDVRGELVLEAGGDPGLFTGTGAGELNRYLVLLNSPQLQSASGLKAGGVLISDSYSYANPGKNDLIVKGRVGIGTAAPNPATQLNVVTSGGGSQAVRGDSPNGNGVVGTSAAAGYAATAGTNSAANGIGVYGEANNGVDAYGVFGRSAAQFGQGVHGEGGSIGVYGKFIGQGPWGVYSEGDLGASGKKAFQIDHPLDPENKYLLHYSAEGPEPLLVYRGNVGLDGSGTAWVVLPDYFEEINKDYSYVLTAVGAAMPNLHVAREIADNRFQIAGGAPGGKVSWEVKGMRHDLYVRHHGAAVERDKPAHERGRYQHPELYGQPPEMGTSYRPQERPE